MVASAPHCIGFAPVTVCDPVAVWRFNIAELLGATSGSHAANLGVNDYENMIIIIMRTYPECLLSTDSSSLFNCLQYDPHLAHQSLQVTTPKLSPRLSPLGPLWLPPFWSLFRIRCPHCCCLLCSLCLWPHRPLWPLSWDLKGGCFSKF